MNQYTRGQLSQLCQMVYRGSKPCAIIPIMNRDFKMAKIVCMVENCKFKSIKLSDGWITLWIYINDEISEIIDLLPKNPETSADHYLLGALFGYSNNAICKYYHRYKRKIKIIQNSVNYEQHTRQVHIFEMSFKGNLFAIC